MRLEGRRKGIRFNRPWTRRYRVALLGLIGINAIAFVMQVFLENCEPGFNQEFLGLSDRGVHDAYSWQFVTAMFLHNGPWQFMANMLGLYFVGRDLESILGQRHFLYLYLAGVLTGEFLHLFVMPGDAVLFAASGGAAALLVADATILPELELISISVIALPIRIKAKHLVYALLMVVAGSLCLSRHGIVSNTGYLGGAVAGWFYAHLLGFGRPSRLQRHLQQRRIATERYLQLSPEQLIAEEIDPLLEKISKDGLRSLTRGEQRRLVRARERILEQDHR
jgi:membrane associated rhomboid family serine protease